MRVANWVHLHYSYRNQAITLFHVDGGDGLEREGGLPLGISGKGIRLSFFVQGGSRVDGFPGDVD